MRSRQRNDEGKPRQGGVVPCRFIVLTLACCAGWVGVYALRTSGLAGDTSLVAMIVLATVASVIVAVK